MKKIYRDYLFTKHLLVSENKETDKAFETVFSLANLFAIRITAGGELAEPDMIAFASESLGERVPEPFYRGFPESVRALTPDQLLFDQLIHYVTTYGFGDFSKPGHSVFEESFERTAFKEAAIIKDFAIISVPDAIKKLEVIVTDLLAGTRPLSEQQFELVSSFVKDYSFEPARIASKNTAVRLLLKTRDLRLTKHLKLSDVIKLVDELHYRSYGGTSLKELNLRNRDRKFVAAVIDALAVPETCDAEVCFEKKPLWNGLLHHIHYRPKTETGKEFAALMRGKENRSAYSEFERFMASGDVRGAVDSLKARKGSGAVLRNLNYLISRCEGEDDFRYVLNALDTRNTILLIQLLIEYAQYRPEAAPRTFTFARFNKLRVHTETEDECAGRRSLIGREKAGLLEKEMRARLETALKGRLGKVYIDQEMERYALPLKESTSQGGFGVLPTGSHLPMEEGRIIRAFTYWEKVNDIDLSMIGITAAGQQVEFSWRTMAGRQSKGIAFSGDQTSGYHGGSEYFDIDLLKIRERYPDLRYLIFCDNVYSGCTFGQCFCRAGYMLRARMRSGEIYEPKTVASAFTVNSDSRFAYLFGIDFDKKDFVWLNTAGFSNAAVAGEMSLNFLTDLFRVTEVINMRSFFELLATEVVETPEEADLIVTNKDAAYPAGIEVIREYDFERVIGLMN